MNLKRKLRVNGRFRNSERLRLSVWFILIQYLTTTVSQSSTSLLQHTSKMMMKHGCFLVQSPSFWFTAASLTFSLFLAPLFSPLAQTSTLCAAAVMRMR